MNHRTPLVYGLLLVVWSAIAGWQYLEHNRFTEAEQQTRVKDASAITKVMGAIINSQRRYFRDPQGFVEQERLEATLKRLVQPGELNVPLNTVALVNVSGEVLFSAHAPGKNETNVTLRMGSQWDDESAALVSGLTGFALMNRQAGVHWERDTVMVVNPVDLGSETTVLPRRDAAVPPPYEDRPRAGRGMSEGSVSNSVGPASVGSSNSVTSVAEIQSLPPPSGRGRRPPPFPRMNDDQWKSLREQRGLHAFAIVMPTQSFQLACSKDLWMRAIIVCFAGISVFGFGLAWRNQMQSSELQMRLLRASELNTHLKEMNIAAAGLAHETRNPLNIIRGVAHMISHVNEASPEIREKSRVITDEVDRVTAQLNEFINYSRPREVRRTPVALNSVVADVVRALDCDLEEKTIRLTVLGEELTVDADEQLLRQVLFNLLINAVQAVDIGGHIQITSKKGNSQEAILEISDNGPGVSNEVRLEIFKPYFTTRKTGTGLGLAVVHQIIMAHGWSIECLANTPRGAIFRVSGMKLPRS